MFAPFQQMSFISMEVKLVLQYSKSKTEITNLWLLCNTRHQKSFHKWEITVLNIVCMKSHIISPPVVAGNVQ